jgi:hypothetical protein
MIIEDEICPWGNDETDLKGVILNSAQKIWLANQINVHHVKSKYLSIKYHLNTKTLNRYARNLKKGVIPQDNSGRPPVFSPEAIKVISDKLTNSKYEMRTSNYQNFLNEQAKNTSSSRNKSISQVAPVSKRTIGRLEKKINILTSNGEITTDSRAVAISDIRNAVSFAAMNLSMEPYVNPLLILNADATQFPVGNDIKNSLSIKYIGHKITPKKILPNNKNSRITKFFIKYFCLISAAGYICNPIFIIQDKHMKEELIDVYNILGLGVGTDITSHGFVVFCNSRQCNIEFYKWFNEIVLIEFIQNIKNLNNLANENAVWLQLDGEKIQIDIYKEKNMTDQLIENNIIVGKPSASTTEITQPCDVGNLFKAAKKRNKSINDSDVKHMTPMIEKLKEMFKQHIQKHNGPTKKSQMTSSHIKMATLGLLRVQLALQDTASPQMVKESFHMAGVFDKTIHKCNLLTMLGNCTTPINNEEETNIINQMDKLIECFRKNGEILENDFDECNIVNNVLKKGKERNELVMSRRRSVILTNLALIQKENKKHNLEKIKAVVALEKREAAKIKRKFKADLKNSSNKKIKIEEEESEEDENVE